MKKLFNSMLLSSAFAISALASSSITVYSVSDDIANIGVKDKQWQNAKEFEILLYPQTTITLNDKNANEINAHNKATKAFVKAVSDGKNIAFKLRWADKTKSIQSSNAFGNTEFADGFAVQFASNYSDPKKLPYIGMGSKDRPVVVYLQKAIEKHFEPNGNGDVETQVNRNNTYAFNSSINTDLENFDAEVEKQALQKYQKAFVSEGFRSMTEIKDDTSKFNSEMNYCSHWFSQNEWEGVIVRSLNDEYATFSKEPFPVAFALWDGEKMGRDGLKNLSTWVVAQFEGIKTQTNFKNEVDYDLPQANIENGESLTKMHCGSCHNYAQTNEAASSYMAPNLSNIGGYSTTPYLIESILEPSAVVVAGYNTNAHSNFAWYYLDENGNRTSAMPAFDYLTQEELNDIVAYLKTLKEEVK